MLLPRAFDDEACLGESPLACAVCGVAARRELSESELLARDPREHAKDFWRDAAAVRVLVADQDAHLGQPMPAIHFQLDVADVPAVERSITDTEKQCVIAVE